MEIFEKFEIRQISHLKQPTIYYFLKDRGISETHIKNLRKNSPSILLNGAPSNTRAKIVCGDILEILKNPKPATQTKLCGGNLEILFEDDDFLVVNKPHNLACTPTRSHYCMNLGGQICKYMQAKDPNFVLRIANRLDRETAGIVVVAKNVIAYNSLSKNKIEKEYHAIVQGNVYENITIDAPILTVTNNGINEIKRVISPQGKPAVTHVEVVENFVSPRKVNASTAPSNSNNNCDSLNLLQNQGLCHVKLSLETGRTHQIRVHLSSIGHPLVGDTLYGNGNTTSHDSVPTSIENSAVADFKNPKNENSHAQPNHTMLLLKKISFRHFRTGNLISLEVPFPPEWKDMNMQTEI